MIIKSGFIVAIFYIVCYIVYRFKIAMSIGLKYILERGIAEKALQLKRAA
jgi:hypothetical protein